MSDSVSKYGSFLASHQIHYWYLCWWIIAYLYDLLRKLPIASKCSTHHVDGRLNPMLRPNSLRKCYMQSSSLETQIRLNIGNSISFTSGIELALGQK